MIRDVVEEVPLYQFELLAKQPALKHFVSGRQGGVSKGTLGSLNMSFNVDDDPENVKENRRRVANSLGIEVEELVFPGQIHSDQIQIVQKRREVDHLGCTDALVTNLRGVCLAVLAADCVPVLLYDPVQKVIAAVHSGWRGTVGKILTKTVKKMEHAYGVNPTDLIVGIGPSISVEKYEVGKEVIEAVTHSFPSELPLLLRAAEGDGKAYFDLWQANKIQLLALGVPEEKIEISGLCTLSNSEEFFSARAFQGKGGRMAAGIMLAH